MMHNRSGASTSALLTDGAAAATLVTYSRRNKDTAEIEWTAAARVMTASNDAQ